MFTEASSALLVLAVFCCSVCAAVGDTCCWLANATCCGVGFTVVPPTPPLKLTWVTVVLLMTVLL